MNKIFYGARLSATVFISALLILASGFFAKSTFAADKSKSSARQISEIDTVMRVIDGDTFIMTGGRHLRLLCLDTPEKGEPYADRAAAFADSLLLNKAVKIETGKTAEDKYGRTLAYLYLGSNLYNEMLLRAGLARIYFFEKNQRYSKELLSAQNDARKAKRGIWSLPAPSPEPYYIAAGGSFRFHRPLCRDIKDINLKKAKRYKTRDAALDLGLSPCRDCKP
jgi:micrococcal nuclease